MTVFLFNCNFKNRKICNKDKLKEVVPKEQDVFSNLLHHHSSQ